MHKSLSVILAVLIAVSGVAPVAAASANNSTATTSTVTQTPSSTPTPTPTATDTDTSSGTRVPGNLSQIPYGIFEEINRDPDTPAPQTVDQQVVDGVYIVSVEFDNQGFAVVEILVTRQSITLSATDSNSIKDHGSGKVAAEKFALPKGRFRVKVPASVHRGDQTIVVGANTENSYFFSDDARKFTEIVPNGSNEYITMTMGVLASVLLVVAIVWKKRRDRRSSVEVGP